MTGGIPAGMPVLIVPGIGDSGPGHWQTLWQARYPEWRRVVQRDWAHPRRDEWVDALDAEVRRCASPPVVIAHSMGCLTVVHWASASGGSLRAALLVAVPDPAGALFPQSAQGFDPVPLDPLACPTLVVASRDDPFGSDTHARRCARAWGSEYVEIGGAGHINVDSGHGAWPEGWTLVRRLMAMASR